MIFELFGILLEKDEPVCYNREVNKAEKGKLYEKMVVDSACRIVAFYRVW